MRTLDLAGGANAKPSTLNLEPQATFVYVYVIQYIFYIHTCIYVYTCVFVRVSLCIFICLRVCTHGRMDGWRDDTGLVQQQHPNLANSALALDLYGRFSDI